MNGGPLPVDHEIPSCVQPASHYRVHKSPTSKPIFAIWMQPAASPLPYLFKIHFNKILPSKWKVPLAFRLEY